LLNAYLGLGADTFGIEITGSVPLGKEPQSG
jgi:hypothetical protein